jgi:NADPH:quinone reductase
VKIEAVSVNPVDTKVRRQRTGTLEAPVILGWDAAGSVEAVGEAVTLFRPGDEVY